jgi:hypothetical protein
MVERSSEVYAVCCSNGLSRIKRSFNRLTSVFLRYPEFPWNLNIVYNIHHCLPPSDQYFTVKTCQFLNHPKNGPLMMSQSPRNQDISNPDFQTATSNEPHLISQGELNDLVRDLNLSKSQAEFLGSQLQGCNLLQKNTNILIFRYWQKDNCSVFCFGWWFGLLYRYW